MTPAPPTATKVANSKSQLGIRLWGQIIAISETLRRIISNLCTTFRIFLILRILFLIVFSNPHVAGVEKNYQKQYYK